MHYNAVLLDDDYFVGREYVEQLNDSRLFHATQAKSPKCLFDLIEQEEFDVAIIDIRMVDNEHLFSKEETSMGYRTGVAVYKKLRDIRPDMIIVALTNDKHPEIISIFTGDDTVAYFDKDVYRYSNFPPALFSFLKKVIDNDIPYEIKHRRFKVGFSFSGEYRVEIEKIADGLQSKFKKSEILYDKYCTAEFARKNLDIYLQNLYHDECDLIVILLCHEYQKKTWCGIEWRAIRDFSIIEEDRVMFLKANDGSVSGVFNSIDGYIDLKEYTLDEIVEFIISRWEMI